MPVDTALLVWDELRSDDSGGEAILQLMEFFLLCRAIRSPFKGRVFVPTSLPSTMRLCRESPH